MYKGILQSDKYVVLEISSPTLLSGVPAKEQPQNTNYDSYFYFG